MACCHPFQLLAFFPVGCLSKKQFLAFPFASFPRKIMQDLIVTKISAKTTKYHLFPKQTGVFVTIACALISSLHLNGVWGGEFTGAAPSQPPAALQGRIICKSVTIIFQQRGGDRYLFNWRHLLGSGVTRLIMHYEFYLPFTSGLT